MATTLPTAVRAPSGKMTEIGQTGLQHTNGFIWEEFLPRLRGLDGARFFREMHDNDPLLWAVCYAMEMLVRQVEWEVQPVDQSPAALEAAEFLEGVLFEDMSHTFTDFISELMSMIPHGYSVFEIVYKVRAGEKSATATTKSSVFDDRKIGVARLAPRSQLTIHQWDIDADGEIRGVWQVLDANGGKSGMVYIPWEKMLLFRTTSKRNNPEGRPVIRGCVVPYLRKKHIEDAEGRAASRAAGVATLKIPSEYMRPDADDAERQAYVSYQNIGKGLATDKQGFLILPSDVHPDTKAPMFEFAYTSVGTQSTVDMTNIVERMDKRMLSSALADFILLGQQSAGSFALSSDKTEMFSVALGGFLAHIKETLNRHLVARLWALNGMDRAVMPKLAHGDIEKVNLEELGNFVQKMAGAGAAFFPDPKLENALREKANLPVTETVQPDGEGGEQLIDDEDGMMMRHPAQATALAEQKAKLEQARAAKRTAEHGGVDPKAPPEAAPKPGAKPGAKA